MHSIVKDNGRTGKIGVGVSYAQGSRTRTNMEGNVVSKVNENSYGMSLYGGSSKGRFDYLLGAQFGRFINYNAKDFDKREVYFVPSVRLTLRTKGNIGFTASFGDDFQYGIYRYLYRGNVGYYFGKDPNRPQAIMVGINNNVQFTLEGVISISDHIAIAPTAYIGNNPYYGLTMQIRTEKKKVRRGRK